MKTNTAKFLPIAEKFFTAYDAHDVDGMLVRCHGWVLMTDLCTN
jgi:hypothetical protein